MCIVMAGVMRSEGSFHAVVTFCSSLFASFGRAAWRHALPFGLRKSPGRLDQRQLPLCSVLLE